MRYPLELKFKIAAISSQIYVTDADGNQIFYVKQKLFKFKENIEIFSDDSKTQKVYNVKADRIIDFSPELTLSDANNNPLGSVKRHGRKSIWRSTYDINIGSQLQLKVTETNPWAKLLDQLLAQIPFLGILSAYIFHPHYAVTDQNGQTIASLEKRPAFFEGKYRLDGSSITGFDEATHRVFAALMMVVVLRERFRG